MHRSRLTLLALALLLALGSPAWAQDDPASRPGAGAASGGFDQIVRTDDAGVGRSSPPTGPNRHPGTQVAGGALPVD